MKSKWFDDSAGESNSDPYGNLEDPAGKETAEINSIFLKNGFRNWKRSLLSVEISISSRDWTCLQTEYPNQKDGFNCGVYVVLILERMMTGMSEEKVTFNNSKTDLIQHRKDIYVSLEAHATYST